MQLAGQGRAGQGRAGHGRAGQGRAGHGRAGRAFVRGRGGGCQAGSACSAPWLLRRLFATPRHATAPSSPARQLPKPWPRLIDDAVPAEIKQLPPCDPATGVALAGWQADGNPAYEAAGQEGTQEGSGGGGASTGVIVGATLGAVAGAARERGAGGGRERCLHNAWPACPRRRLLGCQPACPRCTQPAPPSCACAAVVLGAVLLVLRRRHPRRLAQAAAGDAKGGLPSGTASEEDSGCPPMQPSGSWTPPSSEAAAAAAAAATAAAAAAAAEAAHPPALPANPFAADARGRGALATTWPSPSWPASSARLSLSDASTQLTAGGGSGSATLSAEHRSKLEALQAEAPGWLIPPTRLSLDQGPNGQLVLLGRGGCAAGRPGAAGRQAGRLPGLCAEAHA